MCYATRFVSMTLVLSYPPQCACVSHRYTAMQNRKHKRLGEDVGHVNVVRVGEGVELLANIALTCDTNARYGERSPNAYRMRKAYV